MFYKTKKQITKEEKAVERSFRDIPDDIMIRIFETLPHKSLAKAICVSKHWHFLIHDSIINQTSPKILFTSDHFLCDKGTFLLSSIDTESHVENLQFSVEKTLTTDVKLKFSGSCNGLVLIEAGAYFYIWNPLTKYTKKIIFPFTHAFCFDSKLVLGLCHDSFSNQYKVVMAACDVRTNDYYADVLAVCSGIATSVKLDFGYKFHLFRPGPVLNTYLHLFVEKKCDLREYIVAFDPMVDLFSEVEMPDHRGVMLGLGVLGGCLCMARKESSLTNSLNIEILVMKEYGVASSWVITCSIRNSDGFGIITLVPLCHNNYGEVLVHVNGKRIKMLNISESCIEEVGGVISEHCQYSAVFYEEKFGTPHKRRHLVSSGSSFRFIYCGLVWVQLLAWVLFG